MLFFLSIKQKKIFDSSQNFFFAQFLISTPIDKYRNRRKGWRVESF